MNNPSMKEAFDSYLRKKKRKSHFILFFASAVFIIGVLDILLPSKLDQITRLFPWGVAGYMLAIWEDSRKDIKLSLKMYNENSSKYENTKQS